VAVDPGVAEAYYATACGRLDDLDTTLQTLARCLRRASGFSDDESVTLEAAGVAAREAIAQLLATLDILERTGLGVVDLQGRMKKETRQLVTPLKRIDALASTRAKTDGTLARRLHELEEHAQFAAGALFPSSVHGLDQVNDLILFKLRPLVLPRFNREVDRQTQKGTWNDERRSAVEAAHEEIEKPFRHLTRFLNRLAVEPVDAATIRQGVRSHRAVMAAVAKMARTLRRRPHFSGFGGILGDVRAIALAARKGLLRLEVPLFPAWEKLGPLRPLITKDLYDHLAGVQKFALLNITARMLATGLGDRNLLASDFKIVIWQVFPDRIYLQADAKLIREVRKHTALFKTAPAGLHRFSAGSYKQRRPSRGGLQLSYAPEVEDSTTTVNIDADIDLFKRPFSHFFAEVLVNHLTGSTTSQYRVHDILADQQVPPIGGFEVLHTAALA